MPPPQKQQQKQNIQHNVGTKTVQTVKNGGSNLPKTTRTVRPMSDAERSYWQGRRAEAGKRQEAFHKNFLSPALLDISGTSSTTSSPDAKSTTVPTVVAAPMRATLTSTKGLVSSYDPRIPTSRPSKALSLARTGGSYADQIMNRLKTKSPWYTSIQDPLHGADCKIPDATGEETGVVQLIQKVSQTSSEDGTAGCQVLTPYINLADSAGDTGVNYQVLKTDVSGTTIGWGDGTTIGDLYGYPFDGGADLRGVTNAHRIVSACMIVEHEASAFNNAGEMTMFCFPFSTSHSPLYNSYLNAYSSVQVPLNINKPATIRWFPLAREIGYIADDGSYVPQGTVSYKTFMSTRDDRNASQAYPPYWTFGFVTAGCDPGINFRITIVVNYEFLPSYNTLNILSASPSPIDEEEESLVTGWVETMPAATIISEKKATSSPTTVSPQHGDEPTGFGMIANVISEVLPFVSLLL